MIGKFCKVVISLFVVVAYTTAGSLAYAGKGETEVYYDASFRTSSLGNYEITVNAFETPSYETLPIISKDYFTNSEKKYKTEVDNTSPSATYKANTITKVDVVFATGELGQMTQLEANMANFQSKLDAPSNNFDTKVVAVETVTGGFDMADADVNTIYNFWDQYPEPNNFTLHGNFLLNAVYDWNGRPSTQRSRTTFNHMFIESNSYNVTDFELSSSFAWHGCSVGSGYVFRYNKETDSAYVVICGPNTQLRKVAGISQWLGHNGGNGPFIDYTNIGELLGHNSKMYTTTGNGENLTVAMEGNRITVKCGSQTLIDYTDTNPIKSGGVGLFAGCTVSYNNISLSYETTITKSLGESISDVAWRDGSVRFIVHATDVIPTECLPGNDADFAYTVTKVLNSNAYLINLGTSVNKSALERLMNSIVAADKTIKGFYYDNVPIYNAMNQAAEKIISIAKGLSKPTDWVLINTEILWDTLYKDNEKDLPLNFGEHDGRNAQPQDLSDITLANTWGKPLTHYYTDDKIMAEKWRYKHTPTFFDTPIGLSGFNNIWIPDPIEVFENTGKYRINYKRRDNPLYPDSSLTSVFDNYRYWSTDYDRRAS